MSSLPPLPPGFKLDAPQQNIPPLPAGFTLDEPARPDAFAGDDLLSAESMAQLEAGERSTVTPTPQRSFMDRAGRYASEYLGGIKDAAMASATTENPQTFAERLGNVPVIGPLYGAAEAATTVASGLLAPFAAFADPSNPEAAAQRAIYKPHSAPGKAALSMMGAVAKPAVDLAEETGADVALLPLAAETQALRTVAKGQRDLKQAKTEGQRLTKPATPPSADELTVAAKQAYQRAKDAGAVAAPAGYTRMASGLRTSLREQGFNPKLHPKAAAVVEEIEQAGAGNHVSFDDLEILRRQALAAERSIEADERRVAGLIIDRLDDYADALASGAEPVLAGNAPAAVAARKEARNLYARSRKAMEIGELIERAKGRASQFSGSGEENALRTEFRQLAMNQKRLRRFTQEEQQAIKEVAFGTVPRNALRQIGKLAPTGGLSQWLAIGGTMLNPLAAAVPIAGAAARLGATRLTRNAAQRAEELMRRGPKLEAPAKAERAPAPLTGELMPREPLALPSPAMIAGSRSAPGTALAREQMGLTPDVERAGALHPAGPRQSPPRQLAALPHLPPRQSGPIVVDAQGRAARAEELAAYLDQIGLRGTRGVRQPRAEPAPNQNLFAQLARDAEIQRVGQAFDAERVAAADAARGGYDVQELPASAVSEVTLETPTNRLSQLGQSSPAVESIRQLIKRVESNPSDNTRAVVEYAREVHPAAVEAFKQSGVDVSGYTHVIDNFAIRHVLRKHGDEKAERQRGQLPVTQDDLARLPEIVSDPDVVEHGGLTDRGRNAVIYAKRFADGRVLIVEEARTRQGQLAVASMWKVARQERVPSVNTQSSALTSRTSGGSLPHAGRQSTTQGEHIELSGQRVRSRGAPIEHIPANRFAELARER